MKATADSKIVNRIGSIIVRRVMWKEMFIKELPSKESNR